MKKVTYQDEAREALREGVNELCNAVKVTMGPRGRNVIYSSPLGFPISTKDGVTVAQEFQSDHPQKALGAEMVKTAAQQTARFAGDGTTTATVLASGIINRGLDAIQKHEPNEIVVGIKAAKDFIIEKIKEESTPLTADNLDKLIEIATISANNDPVLGGLIAKAVATVGPKGVVKAEESATSETFLEEINGARYPKGMLHPMFITNKSKGTCELNETLVLLCDYEFRDISPLKRVLNHAAENNKSLLVVCDDLSDNVLRTLVHNHVEGNLNVCVTKKPGYGEESTQRLIDMSLITGATPIIQETNMDIDEIMPEHLGLVDKVISGEDFTSLFGGEVNEEKVKERMSDLEEQLANTESQTKRDNLKERLTLLKSKACIIKIGGSNDTEVQETAFRVDDAVSAVFSALEMGYVSGGGVALAKISNNLHFEDNVTQLGADILFEAAKDPFRQILLNAGIPEKAVEIPRTFWDRLFGRTYAENTVTAGKYLCDLVKGEIEGFNSKTKLSANMLEDGVIDPTKVTITALENAVGVACLLLITDCVIYRESHD